MRAIRWQGCQMRSMEAGLADRRRRIQAGIAADRLRGVEAESPQTSMLSPNTTQPTVASPPAPIPDRARLER